MVYRQKSKRKWEIINKRSKRKSNYPSFEKSLDWHFGDDPPKTHDDLREEMKRKGFRTVDNEREYPTNRQVDFAFDYLKKKYFPRQEHITDYFVAEKYDKHYVHRANRNIYIRGKLYKNGQFLPKHKED